MRLRLRTTFALPELRNLWGGLQGANRRRVLLAMAREFERVSRANFGPRGLNRPSRWAKLSANYARWKGKKYGRTDADLILTGKLQSSIRSECKNDNYSEVHAGEGLAYAEAHQRGLGNMPRRPFL